jgi:hypothetical protein
MYKLIWESGTAARELRDREEATLVDLKVISRLRHTVATADGLARFAEAFYFIRCDFVRINFLIGSRCGRSEVEWGGLARNLYEELGADHGKTHNQLYREFLAAAGCTSEGNLREPRFARRFNTTWTRFATSEALTTALFAVAAYEVLDGPDYSALHDALRGAIPSGGLEFFRIHAAAEHFELFGDLCDRITDVGQAAAFRKGAAFVLKQQHLMWKGLLQHLEMMAARSG